MVGRALQKSEVDNYTLLIYGSTTNGLACKGGSDLDLSLTIPTLETGLFLDQEQLQLYFTAIQKELNDELYIKDNHEV